jgi:hypothetical protein
MPGVAVMHICLACCRIHLMINAMACVWMGACCDWWSVPICAPRGACECNLKLQMDVSSPHELLGCLQLLCRPCRGPSCEAMPPQPAQMPPGPRGPRLQEASLCPILLLFHLFMQACIVPPANPVAISAAARSAVCSSHSCTYAAQRNEALSTLIPI